MGGKQLDGAVRSFAIDPSYRYGTARGQTLSATVSPLALAWCARAGHNRMERMLCLAYVGPAHTVQIWEYAADTDRPCMIYYNHSDEITTLVWSPDTTMLASASEDRTVRIWNAGTGDTSLVERVAGTVVRTLAWSPDGNHIAIGCDDNTIRVVSLAACCTRILYTGHATGRYGIDALAWSPDGSRIASAGDDATVQIWDACTGVRLLTYEGHGTQWVLALAWSPDGCWLASGGDDIHIWSALTGVYERSYGAHNCSCHWIDAISWSPDGCCIASASTDRLLHIWDARSASTLRTYAHPGSDESRYGLKANVLAWLPDMLHEQYLAFASYDKIVSLIRMP